MTDPTDLWNEIERAVDDPDRLRRLERAVEDAHDLGDERRYMLSFAEKRGWATDNPCKRVDKPKAGGRDPDIRFLVAAELEALLAATPSDDRGAMERVMYLTAAMTGLRRGELPALRWRDVDWASNVIRVRRS